MKFVYSTVRTSALVAVTLFPAFAESPDVMNRWYESIRQNDLTAVRALLRTSGVNQGVNQHDERGSTPLTYAAAVGSPEAVELLAGAGADINTQNAFGVSPLMLAITEPRKVRTLLDHGADVNAKSKVGRTPLLLACMTDGASATVRQLIAKGAEISVRDEARNTTPLLAATAANDTLTAELLLARGASANDRDMAGITPLMNASSYGNVKLMRELVLRGADVNAVTELHLGPPVKNGHLALGLFTPLILAAATGGTEAVTFLLDSGAKVDEQDVRGMTALITAVASDRADPHMIQTLLAHHADPAIKDKTGMSAVDWARAFARPEVLRALQVNAPVTSNTKQLDLAAWVRPDLRQAVAGSAALLQRSSQTFLKEGGCVSCHAQEMTAVAIHAASKHGVAVDEKIRDEQRRSTELQFASGEYMLMQRMDPPVVDILDYALFHLDEENAPPSRITDAAVHNIAAQQRQNGRWNEAGTNRAPMQDGDFSRTALSIRAIRRYGSKGRSADLNVRVQRAAAWLANAHPVTTDDRVMQILGLYWAQTEKSKKQDRVQDLLALRNADGGWAQSPFLSSDAYATGEVLYALHELGISVKDAAYQRGVDFLLRTRAEDGSWHVKSRAPKFQPWFEGGFPHEGDQWISSAATAWATAALAYAIPAEKPVLAAHR